MNNYSQFGQPLVVPMFYKKNDRTLFGVTIAIGSMCESALEKLKQLN